MMRTKKLRTSNFLKIFINSIFIFLLFSSNSFSFELSEYQKHPKSYYSIGSLISRYKQKDLLNKLKKFVSATRPSRYPGREGHLKSIPWIMNQIKSNKASHSKDVVMHIEEFEPDINYAKKLYQEDFEKKIANNYPPESKEFKKWKGFTENIQKNLESFKKVKGKNLVWEKKGHSDSNEILIFGSHYDTISYDNETLKVIPDAVMPGADDNASGVAALIALIEILNEVELKKTIRIIFFDFQELGSLGSRAYVKKHKEELLKYSSAYINVEMIGHDTKNKDSEKKLRNFKIYIRRNNENGFDKDKKLSEMLVQSGKKTRSPLKVEVMANHFDNSDHINFWEIGIPALAFSQNIETDFNGKRHHTPNDFPETINGNSYYAAFKFLAGSALSWGFDINR